MVGVYNNPKTESVYIVKTWDRFQKLDNIELLKFCINKRFYKVGDSSLIFDIMAGMMVNISSITVIGRTTVAAVYRTAQIVASLPNLTYSNKARTHIHLRLNAKDNTIPHCSNCSFIA